MPRDPRKRQKALDRKAQKQKQRHTLLRRQRQADIEMRSGSPNAVRTAASWPVHEVLVARDWEDPMQITQVVVARRAPGGQVAAGVFLVDLACLGVKSAFARIFETPSDYRAELRDGLTERQEMIGVEMDLAAKILGEAVTYARDLGFEPDPDYHTARLLLGDANPDACPAPVPLGGPNGKPFFVQGPNDNPGRVIRTLTTRLGPTGFEYMGESDIASELGATSVLPGEDQPGDDEEEPA